MRKTALPVVCGLAILFTSSACDIQRNPPTAPSGAGAAENNGPGGSGPSGGGPTIASSEWTTAEWREWFFDLVEKHEYPNATGEAMAALRPFLNAQGADWQNGWRGDYRTRIYLPSPDCPPPTTEDAPGCSYDKPVDVGKNGDGGPWTWVPRFN